MEIKRNHYLKILTSKMHNDMVKVIVGIRRCGKSYLLNNIFYNYLLSTGVSSDHIIKFSFESKEDLKKINQEFYKSRNKNKLVKPENFCKYIDSQIKDDGNYYLLFDEIQELEGFPFIINGYRVNPKLDVYVTGSNAKFLSKDVITEFRGRGDKIFVYPLTFAEFYAANPGNEYKRLKEYKMYGGLPYILSLSTHAEKSEYLKNLFSEIYLKDIFERYHIGNHLEEFEELLDILSSSVGSLNNINKIANTFETVKHRKISYQTLVKYIEYLKDSFLIQEVKQYDVNGRKYIGALKKYYFTDLGLRNARRNFKDLDESHNFENVVYNELKFRGFDVDVGLVEKRERNTDGKLLHSRYEVDFVANQGYKRYYLQCTYSIPSTKKQLIESRPLFLIKDHFKKVLIAEMGLTMFYSEQGILNLDACDFLLLPNSLNE